MAFDEHTEGARPQGMKENKWLIKCIHLWVIVHRESHPHFSFQFFIYASYFAAISLLFTVRGVYTVLHMKRPAAGNRAERATDLPEGSRPWRPSENTQIFIKLPSFKWSVTTAAGFIQSIQQTQGVKVRSPRGATRGHYLHIIKQQELRTAALWWLNLNTEMLGHYSVCMFL